jgi:hypothetical protein
MGPTSTPPATPARGPLAISSSGAGGEVCRDARRDVGDLETGDLGELAVRGHGFDAELDWGYGGATCEVVEPTGAGGALDEVDRATLLDVLVAVLRVQVPSVGLADLTRKVIDDLLDGHGFVGREDVEALLPRYIG